MSKAETGERVVKSKDKELVPDSAIGQGPLNIKVNMARLKRSEYFLQNEGQGSALLSGSIKNPEMKRARKDR